MKRTSKALKRLGVPVLAATTILTAGQFALSTSAFAATNGTLTIVPDPAFGTATPTAGTGQTPDQTVTYTAGDQSGAQGDAAQTINLSVSGSAQIVQPAGAQTAGSTLTIAAGGKTAQCTTAATAGGPPKTASCKFSTIDNVSESVQVTASDPTDPTTPPVNATNNFAGLFWNNCPNNAPNTTANCVTQTQVGTQTTYTVKYFQAGAPAANIAVTFTVSGGGAVAQMSTTQPTGTAFFSPGQANCTTNAQGECSVTVIYNSTGTADLTATTSNTGQYPSSRAVQRVNIIPSTAAGRLVQTSSTRIQPPTQASNANQPGDAVQNTYTLYPCANNTTNGNNACAADTAHPLSGVQVALTVDHGFFTPNCKHAASNTTNYANCTFDPAPAAGGKVGNLKSLGANQTVTTDTNGQFTVTLGIGRDAAFDQNGNLIAVVSGTVGNASVTESNGTGNSVSTTTCNTVGQSGNANGNDNAPQAGCSTGTPWTTDVKPLNGGTIKIVSVPATNTEPALSDSGNNNVPVNQGNTRTFYIQLTDQFGNLTSGGPAASTGATLATSGVGDVQRCTNYSNSTPCTNSTTLQNGGGASTISNDQNGNSTRTYANVRGSYLAQFTSNGTPTQDRYIAFNNNNAVGLQTLTATWAAPTTTFNTFTAATNATPAVATYTTGTNNVTDVVKINWYLQNEQAVVTFTTTPSNSVDAGTVVTVSATVKDQFGNPIQGDGVQFVRSGPNPNNGTDCSATNGFVQTNAAGQAGFSFTCNSAGTQVVTIVVQDASGNELARGTQTITFAGSSTGGKTAEKLKLACFSRHPHKIKCVAQASPAKAGLTVVFFDKRGHKVGTDTTNVAGKAVLRLGHKKSGRTYTFQAHLRASHTTFAADSKRAKVTVQ